MKLFKSYKYIVALFCTLFLYINASWSNEISIGIIKLSPGPVQKYLLPNNPEEKDYVSEEDPDKKQMMLEWQIPDFNYGDQTKVTATFQQGAHSYVYKGSEVFTDGDKPELISFAGVYQKDNHKFAFAYKIERIQWSEGGTDNYKWRFTYIEPFDTTTEAGQARLISNPFTIPDRPDGIKRVSTALSAEYTEIPISVRADYKFDKTNRRTIYSTNMVPGDRAFLDTKFDLFNKNVKNNTELDKTVIDLGKYGKVNNVTIKYCAFDINEDPLIDDQDLRFVYWTELDQPEWVVDKNSSGEIKSIQKALAPNPPFDFFYFKNENEVFFNIDSRPASFHLTRLANDLSSPEKSKLEKFSVPTAIKKLDSFKFAKKEFWSVDGEEKGKDFTKPHNALCYSFRSYVKSTRASYTSSGDFDILKKSINELWPSRKPDPKPSRGSIDKDKNK